MLSKTFSLMFFLRKLRGEGKGKQSIYVRITVDEKRVEISAKRQWDPKKWNTQSGRATGNKEEVKILNAYLDALQNKVFEAHSLLLQTNENITAEKIKSRLLGVTEKPKLILEIFRYHNEQLKSLVGHTYAPLTYKRYETAYEHTKEFIKQKYGVSDLSITSLNYDFITEYEFYLKSSRKCAHNSAMKYLTNFKKIVLLCVKKGWLNKDPFYGFKLAKKSVVRDFLTQYELDIIASKEFTTPRIKIARDIFLFSCYTGLAYVDVHKLKRSELRIGIDGEKWIFISRQKTEELCPIPLLPVCIEILKKYDDHPACLNKDRVLPVSSNQKMNEYLKEIADVCGINKLLTYHLARHTFATTVTLSNGVPIETVAKMLGHRSLRTTQHYAKILHTKISSDMSLLKSKLSQQKEKQIM